MSDALPAQEEFAVLVFDMAHTGAPAGEHVVPGFPGVAAARAYAEARIRASVEELRKPGIADAHLRSLWFLYGEDCKVVGDDGGPTDIDLYIAIPATPAECDWPALTPLLRRFHAVVSMSNANGDFAWAGGFIHRYTTPSRNVLMRLFLSEARAAFQRKGVDNDRPTDLSVMHLFELPLPPTPPDRRPQKAWRVEVDFVCHDIKYGASAGGVFLWPEAPDGWGFRCMINVLIADSLALRGDGPVYLDCCDILATRVSETDAEANYRPNPVETPFSA